MRLKLDARLQRQADHPVVLALSGGGDSMALLVIAADWARAHGRRLTAVTVDHGLNPASADWGRACQRAARAVGADWIERRWLGDKPSTGLTAAARAARHALIAEAARAVGAPVVLLAHTADDIAESDWMRARAVSDGGSTLGGLTEWTPSPAWPEGRGLMLLRPMLGERREVLRRFLRGRGIDWIEDPANADVRFGRSRARLELARLAPGEPAAPADAAPAASVRRTADAVRVAPRPLPLGAGFVVGRGTPAGTLGAVVLCASGGDRTPRRDRIDALAERLGAGEDLTASLCGARVAACGDAVAVGREPGEFRRRPPADLSLAAGRPGVWDGRYEIVAPEAGWTVTAAAGRAGRLSDADRTVLKRLPAWARGAAPVLIRDAGDAPVLAWRRAEVRALVPRRLALFLGARTGETTQEADLFRAVHGETPPPDLFS